MAQLTNAETREQALFQAVHSSEMEGGGPSPEFMADAKDYLAGLIDESDLLNRTRCRYGLAVE